MVYLDNHATTRLDPRVLDAMRPALEGDGFGNPSSTHRVGVEAARLLNGARSEVLEVAPHREMKVIFTSGATEANALALFGRVPKGRRKRIVLSAIEHPSVLNCARELEQRGCALSIIDPGGDGVVPIEETLAEVNEETALVALMLVNNEIGTVQPVGEIARALHRRWPDCHLHVDATQAIGLVELSALTLADSVAISAHKIHGPKGSGALLYRGTSGPRPLWFGGGQEGGIRSGTQNVAGAVGLARAVSLALEGWQEKARGIGALRDQLVDGIEREIEGAFLVGSRGRRSPANAAIAFESVTGDVLVGALEARGIIASTGSACHAGRPKPSHVLTALGHPRSAGVLRFGLSRETTKGEIELTIDALRHVIGELRR